MENQLIEGRKDTFQGPTGFQYTIREQNGADDDVLSNPSEARSLKNLARFISGIVVSTDFTSNGKLTMDDVYTKMPLLDVYTILLRSRIHSLGNEIEFDYDWGKEHGGKVGYTQDINEFLHDYSEVPEEEVLLSKPDAIPFYPSCKDSKDLKIVTPSGKEVYFDLATLKAEAYRINLPLEKQTMNQELISRNLRVMVNDTKQVVRDFRMFSVADMKYIRNQVSLLDPVFKGDILIQNPSDPTMEVEVNIMGLRDFFYQGGI